MYKMNVTKIDILENLCAKNKFTWVWTPADMILHFSYSITMMLPTTKLPSAYITGSPTVAAQLQPNKPPQTWLATTS